MRVRRESKRATLRVGVAYFCAANENKAGD